MTIKAIETIYKGYKFRSRLEARFAVFFDAMGEKWEYEKEGFDLNGEYYLPDFYLPRHNLYVEIKGTQPTFAEIMKCDSLCNVGQGIILIHGLPLENIGKLFCYEIKESGSGGNSH